MEGAKLEARTVRMLLPRRETTVVCPVEGRVQIGGEMIGSGFEAEGGIQGIYFPVSWLGHLGTDDAIFIVI